MAFEAILLASILARQFRVAQIDKLIAEKYARTDPLTELNNRRGFQELTEPLWQQIVYQKGDASLLLIDVDSFKDVNDTHGHSVGDEVLKAIAKVISESCRQGDISARWGGEEFIVFLPHTSRDSAITQAEVIREAIEKVEFLALELSLTLTASFGVAGSVANQFEDAPLTLARFEPMIKNADRALYIAKYSGKNQVRIVS
jgi:diguanylate cyclase (GGDEF)-like protein